MDMKLHAAISFTSTESPHTPLQEVVTARGGEWSASHRGDREVMILKTVADSLLRLSIQRRESSNEHPGLPLSNKRYSVCACCR